MLTKQIPTSHFVANESWTSGPQNLAKTTWCVLLWASLKASNIAKYTKITSFIVLEHHSNNDHAGPEIVFRRLVNEFGYLLENLKYAGLSDNAIITYGNI